MPPNHLSTTPKPVTQIPSNAVSDNQTVSSKTGLFKGVPVSSNSASGEVTTSTVSVITSSSTDSTTLKAPLKASTPYASWKTSSIPFSVAFNSKANSLDPETESPTSESVHPRKEDPWVPSQVSSSKPLPSSKIFHIKPFLKPPVPYLKKSDEAVTSSSVIFTSPVAFANDHIVAGRSKTTTASRIIYITLLTKPTTPSTVVN